MTSYSPWRDVGERYPDWVVRVRSLEGPREVMCFDRQVILIDPGSNSAERRCSLGHALAHIDLGHDVCAPTLRAEQREESAADLMAARRLIHIDALIRVALWTDSPIEACEELRVDIDTLRCRGAHLHPGERAGLNRALSTREQVA